MFNVKINYLKHNKHNIERNKTKPNLEGVYNRIKVDIDATTRLKRIT